MGLFQDKINRTKLQLEADVDNDRPVNINLGDNTPEDSPAGKFDPDNVQDLEGLNAEISRRTREKQQIGRDWDWASGKDIADKEREIKKLTSFMNKARGELDMNRRHQDQDKVAALEKEVADMKARNQQLNQKRNDETAAKEQELSREPGFYQGFSTEQLDDAAFNAGGGNTTASAQEPQAPSRDPSGIDPDTKSLARRGVEAIGRKFGRGLKAAGAQIMKGKTKDPFGNLGLGGGPGDKARAELRADLKSYDKRLGKVQVKVAFDDGELKQQYQELESEWRKVKSAVLSYPEKNKDWISYISTKLSRLEQQLGLQPQPGTFDAQGKPRQTYKDEPEQDQATA